VEPGVTGGNFGRRLLAIRRQRRLGLLLCALLRVAGWGALLLVAWALLDLWLAPGTIARLTVDSALLVLLAGLTLAWAGGALRLSSRDAARHADAALHNRRRQILSALELLQAGDAPPPAPPERAAALRPFLVARTVNVATAELARLSFRNIFPFSYLRISVYRCLLALVPLLLGLVLQPDAARTLAQRIFFPWRDVPPYSCYRFDITPAQPNVLYDGTLELRLALRGPPARGTVWLQTRHASWRHRVACFQEGPGQYAQRLEKVTVPLEFCFALGKARSRWQRVEVLLQPQIALAELTLTPPAYARLPVRQFPAGADELAGLAETGVRLQITSNRPLLDGAAVLRPDGTSDELPLATGSPHGPRALAFTWSLRQSGAIEVTIRDLQGTPCRQPLRLRQRLLPDAPPEVVLTEPGEHVLATPSVVVPFRGRIEDDLGLSRVEWIRTVVGYRDRAEPAGPQSAGRILEVAAPLDLGALGVQPGQLLDVYIEARDSNPALTGVAASSVCRIQVISEDDYAAFVRARTTVAEFQAKFQALTARLQAARTALEALRDAAAQAPGDPKRGDALAAAREATQAAADTVRQLAADFAAYEIEERLRPELQRLAGQLDSQATRLGQTAPDSPDLGALANDLLAELGAAGEGAARLAQAGDEAARVAELMACAGRYREVVRRQAEIAGRLRRYSNQERVLEADRGVLASLAALQRENRAALTALVADLHSKAAALPQDYASLAESAVQFADKVEAIDIEWLMDQADAAAQGGRGTEAHHAAQLALERLEQLLSDCDGSPFGDLCGGEITFTVPRDLGATLAQLLAGLSMQMGLGGGAAPGSVGKGPGGAGPVGTMAGGQSLLNVPAYGPTRLTLAAPGSGGGVGEGPGRPGQALVAATLPRPEPAGGSAASRPHGNTLPMEQVPPKYAAAVRRYFSGSP
jgi:hypothetical protein